MNSRMKAKLVNEAPKIYVLVFDTGDEVNTGMTNFAKQNKLTAASYTAIGAFSNSDLGYFSFADKDYKKIPIAGASGSTLNDGRYSPI